MGNGEQYIWKPPEEDEMIMPGAPQLENGHSLPTAVEVTSPSLSHHCRRGPDICLCLNEGIRFQTLTFDL